MVFTDKAPSSLDETTQVAAVDVSITGDVAKAASASKGRSIADTEFNDALSKSLSDGDFRSIDVNGTKSENGLKGNGKAGIFVGGAGDDTIFGNEGQNLIVVESGTDTIFTGAEKDTIVLNPNAKVIVKDFSRQDFLGINTDLIDPNNIQTARQGDDTVVRDKSTGKILAELEGVQEIDDFRFTVFPGRKIKLDNFVKLNDLQVVQGGNGNDRIDIKGQAKHGLLFGNGGNDTLIG